MKLLIPLVAVWPSIALAAGPAPQASPPTTVQIPSTLALELGRFLASETPVVLLNELNACLQAQIPQPNGTVIDRGQCPAVSAALRAEAPPSPMPPMPAPVIPNEGQKK